MGRRERILSAAFGLDWTELGLLWTRSSEESWRCGEERGGCGLGRGSREAAPGLDAGRGKSQELLLATRRCLAWLELRAWAKD